MGDEEYSVRDVKGNVYYVDFERHVFGKNRVVLLDRNERPVGEVVMIGDRFDPLNVPKKISGRDFESSKGKKIIFMNLRAKESDVVSQSRTEEIKSVYKKVA